MSSFSSFFTFIFALFLLLFFSGHGFAEEISQKERLLDGSPIEIKADNIIYDGKLKSYKTNGNVEIIHDKRVLKADIITVNIEKREAEAVGNVTLADGEDILTSDRIEINLETQKGTIYNGKLFFKKENFYITGKKIEKQDKDTYKIYDGTFTTCDGPSPPWKFTCKDLRISAEGYATVKHAKFFIKEIPVFYFPYIIYPVKTKRATGFLIPSIGSSNDEGREITLPFFWAISENMDATFSLDSRSKRGVGESLEYRYIMNRKSAGILSFYHMREMDSYRDFQEERKGEALISDPDRWTLQYRHKHQFDPSFAARIDVTQISDRDFYKDFGERFDNNSKEELESIVFVNHLWQRFNFNAESRYTEDLKEEDKTTLQRLPSFDLSAETQRISGSSLLYSFTSVFDNFWREEGLTGQRIDVYPKISSPFYTDYFKVIPELRMRETLYRLHEKEDEWTNREIYEFNLGLSTAFQRVFHFHGRRLDKLKHSFKPELKYVFIPEVSQDGLPNFDSVDSIEETNSIEYSITSDITGKIFEDNDNNSSYYHKFLRLKLGQRYNITEARRTLESSDDSRRPFSPFLGEFDIYPTKKIFLKLDGEYDTDEDELTAYNALMGIRDTRGDSLSFDYRNTKDTLEDINTKFGLQLWDSVNLQLENRYSRFNGLSLENLLRLEYDAQCWGVRVQYSDRFIPDEDRKDQGVMIIFSLRGVGEFGG